MKDNGIVNKSAPQTNWEIWTCRWLHTAYCSQNKQINKSLNRSNNEHERMTRYKLCHLCTNAYIHTVSTGGRHYSDRLCSDRRYSDNPQPERPSTSLARLGIEIVENGKNWRGSRRRMHRKHGIDRDTEVSEGSAGLGRVSRWGLGCPLPGKAWNFPLKWHISVHLDLFSNLSGKVTITTYLQHNCTAQFSGFAPVSFQSVLPVCLFNYSQPPNVLTVDCRNSVCRNRVCRNSMVYPVSTSCVIYCWAMD